MSDIAGRLDGVTVLVRTRPFLSDYICAVLAEARACTVISALGGADVMSSIAASGPLVACLDGDMEGVDLLMPALEEKGVRCLILLGARPRDEPPTNSRWPTLRQPFAGFQVVDAMESLVRRPA
jgi:hypothetical protein